MGVFKIRANSFEWIGGTADDPQDLCLHGHVTAQFGDTVLEDTGTVSATALYLLKTLTEDKVMAYHDIQMIPCCGHFLIANNDLTEVQISGCDTGTDWSTIHEGNNIRFILPSGQEEIVTLRDYQYEVLNFAKRTIEFSDFQVGDKVIIGLYDSEKQKALNGAAVAESLARASGCLSVRCRSGTAMYSCAATSSLSLWRRSPSGTA